MIPARIRLSVEVTNRLKSLKARTGMDHNVFCRIGLCYSLNDPRPASPGEFDERGQEISRTTLLGEMESAYLAVLRERCVQDGLDPSQDLAMQLRAHINRGVLAVSGRVKDLGDLGELLPQRPG